jgi:F-type H+-transporting ATPase subunit b
MRLITLIMLSVLFAPTAMAAGSGSPTIGPEAIATAITTLVVFLIVLVVLAKFVFPPVGAALAARAERIEAAVKAADEAQLKAKAMLDQYNAKLATADGEVRAIIARAQTDAENIATNIRTRAQQESEEIRERAERDIEQAKSAAIKDIYAQAAELSTSIAEKILRRNLSVDDQRSLVAESLSKLDANKN